MNTDFLRLLMEKTHFPEEAKKELEKAAAALNAKGAAPFTEAADRYPAFCREELADRSLGYGYAIRQLQPLLEQAAEAAGISIHTVSLFLLVESAVAVREDWLRKGRPEQVFWDTFEDLRYKVIECRQVKGVWGNFVSTWYPIFYTDRIVKLGRLEYETITYAWEPFSVCGLSVERGDTVLSIHIPSSGEPFDEAARLASYRLAWEWFRDIRKDGKLVCVCHSWLLYPPYAEILSPASNFVSFQKDFLLADREETDEFHDGWRIFGAAAIERPLAEWPEDTSMQRAIKQALLSGTKPGLGKGVLVCDGETLLTRRG